MPLGDIMKELRKRKNSFQKRAEICSNPRIPAIPMLSDSSDQLEPVREAKL